jgi:hypothetical protein
MAHDMFPKVRQTWRVAILLASGPLAVPPAILYIWLNSTRTHLLQPLAAAGAAYHVQACLDQVDRKTMLPKMMQGLLGARLWLMRDACDGLEDEPLRCCTSSSNACDADFLERKGTWQWYRLMSCYNRLVVEPDVVPFDFIIRSRIDLWWVAGLHSIGELLARGAQRVTLRYKSACHLGKTITLGHLQQAYYKIGPRACSDTLIPVCDELEHPCETYDDQFAIVPAPLADTYFRFAARRLTPAYAQLREAVPTCTGWRSSEGRLTEYLLANATPIRVTSFPMQLAGATHPHERDLPSWLVAGERDWDPSTPIECQGLNDTWGVGAWMLQEGLLNDTQLARRVSRSYIMKHVHTYGRKQTQLIKLVPEPKHALFVAALKAYATRFLIRRPTQSYRIDWRTPTSSSSTDSDKRRAQPQAQPRRGASY